MSLPNRIYIIGQSGSGKTTFASKLAALSGLPHHELDIFWHKYAGDRSAFKKETMPLVAGNAWIIEGKHQTVRREIMDVADLIIFLDFPARASIANNVKRAAANGEEVGDFSKHLLKVAWEFRATKRKILAELSPYRRKLVVLRSFADVDRYLKSAGNIPGAHPFSQRDRS